MGRPNEECLRHAADVANARKFSALHSALEYAGIAVALSIFMPFGMIAAAIGAGAAVYLLDQWADADAKYLDDIKDCNPNLHLVMNMNGGDGVMEKELWI